MELKPVRLIPLLILGWRYILYDLLSIPSDVDLTEKGGSLTLADCDSGKCSETSYYGF